MRPRDGAIRRDQNIRGRSHRTSWRLLDQPQRLYCAILCIRGQQAGQVGLLFASIYYAL
ncbi:MAG TPA: hypothetical protein VEK08_26420 [Planctomycetota bacterium]|nr:hypothetical protein [Planctomycetota bacterium]